jgi:hypothetical protein
MKEMMPTKTMSFKNVTVYHPVANPKLTQSSFVYAPK